MTAKAGPTEPGPNSLDSSQIAKIISIVLAHISCVTSSALVIAATSGPMRVKDAELGAFDDASPLETDGA